MITQTNDGYEDHRLALLALHNTPPVAMGLRELSAEEAYKASVKSFLESKRRNGETGDEQAQKATSSD